MKNVADVYPLTPLQSGMLFHTLTSESEAFDRRKETKRKGTYVNQFTCVLTGEVDSERLQQAWRETIERHAVLRTAVLWEGLDEPLQVVRETVALPWQQMDWRGVPADVQGEKLSAFLRRDRTQSFDLSQAPLLRLTLIQLSDNTHQFILTNHHLLYDGWSLLLIWQDVLTFYASPNSSHTLEPVRPFRDYVAWQQQQDVAATQPFWQQQLQSLTVPTSLPAAHPPREVSAKPYQQQTIQLDAELTQQLTLFARQHRLTMNTLVQGAWALLLSHYDPSASQVAYGTVVSGRPPALRGVEKMVGLFINTLPVSVDVSPTQSLIPWLKDRQSQLLALREHESTPLSTIQRWSELPKGTPLFESIVAFENLTAESAPSLSFKIRNEQYIEQSNYPLALLVFPQTSPISSNTEPQKTLDLRLLYDVDRFDDNTFEAPVSQSITQLLIHLKQLLTFFLSNPTATLADLPRFTPDQQQQLSQFTQLDYPKDLAIHQLIEAQVVRSPNATALTYADQSLTYTELNQQSNQLASELCARGVGRHSRVAICMPRSLDMIIAILAVLKAGATYVPLDPTYPESRLNYCLQDVSPHLLITHRSIDKAAFSVDCLYPYEVDLTRHPTANLEPVSHPTDLAYIIYTSGSTGQPKGVMVTHRNLVHSTTARFAVYAQPVDCFLLLSSIAFDSSVAGLFWTLCQGGELVVAPRRIEQDLYKLATLIDARQVTHTLCVPTLYGLLLTADDLLPYLSSLSVVIVAGEACSRTLAQQHHRTLPTAELYNEYGPTEATVWCSAYRVPAALPPGPVAIGSAIPNSQVLLLNSALQAVPPGAVGEIYIGGEGVTQGYVNQPQKTQDVFVKKEKAVLYKTGDLGRYRSDGCLEWLGRCDRQVKIRGYRIELGEIEEKLRSQPNVQDAVVIAVDHTPIPSTAELVTALASLPLEQAEQLLAQVEAAQYEEVQ